MSKRLVLRAALCATICALIAAPSTSAWAASSPYVALGDSYSSEHGHRHLPQRRASCLRSVYAYPSLLASSKGYSLNFRACSGATAADVTNLQLGAVTSSIAYVSLTVGGNDAGFADVLTECAQPAWAGN